MASMREFLACTGVDIGTSNSVLVDFFGFAQRRVPRDTCVAGTTTVSLIKQIEALKGHHIHLNIIRIGNDKFSTTDEENIDAAILITRRIYSTRNLGIGRVEHYGVAVAGANGKDVLDSEAEAKDLTNDWKIANNAIDIYFVVDINYGNGVIGESPIKGPCNKNTSGWGGMIGGKTGRGADGLGRTLAHELGHYRGLKHNHSDNNCPGTPEGCNNLMAQTGCATGSTCGATVCSAVRLTTAQGDKIHTHCFVQSGC